jgi:hypothetical protein
MEDVVKYFSVNFAENVDQEVNAVVSDMALASLAESIRRGRNTVPDDMQAALVQLLSVVTDLFSTDLPDVGSPEDTLRQVSREIQLARLLRERGLFRLYRLVHTTQDGIPLYLDVTNPATGSPFTNQEEFLGWFCSEAKVARSLVFQRMNTIDKLLEIGYDLQGAFKVLVSKPYAVRETLNKIGHWEKGRLEAVDPRTMINLAQRLDPDSLPQIAAAAEAAEKDPFNPDNMGRLKELSKPLFTRLLDEVADHDRAKDALHWVKNDLLLEPEISYRWEEGVLMVEIFYRSVDPDTGEMYEQPPVVIPFVPDTASQVPPEVVMDMTKRLPLKNRNTLAV